MTAPALGGVSTPPAPTLKLTRSTDARDIARSALSLTDRHGFEMMRHWHRVDWVADPDDPDQLDLDAVRLLCGSVFTLLDLLADRDRGDATFLVIVDDRLAGARFLQHTRHPDVVTTGGWLAAEHRGQGHGSHVLRVLTALAHRSGARFVSTATRADNPAAAANLARCGYVRTPHLDTHGVDLREVGVTLDMWTHPADGLDAHACPVWHAAGA